MHVQVFACCLRWEAVAGYVEGPSGLFSSLRAGRMWKHFPAGSGSQEATFVLHWCLKSSLPPVSLCSPAHCMASVPHQPFSWAGWVRSFPAAWWLCAGCLACFRQRALGKPPNPPLSLTASVVPALSFFLSPPLLLPQQHRASSSLGRGCFSPRGFSAVWTEAEVGQHLWVSLWILMVPEACSDRWEVFIKCSWVCLWNKLGCCPYHMFCRSGLGCWWCNLGANVGSKVPAFNRTGTKYLLYVYFRDAACISYTAQSKPVPLMLYATSMKKVKLKSKCKGSFLLLLKMLKGSFENISLIGAIQFLCTRDLYLMNLPEEL